MDDSGDCQESYMASAVTLTATETEATPLTGGVVTETETEATHLIGDVVPVQDAEAPRAAASVEIRCRPLPPTWREDLERLSRRDITPPPPADMSFFSRLARLWRRSLGRFDPDSISVCQPLTGEQLDMIRRHNQPGHFERLALDRQLTKDCLHYYNQKNPGNEYEPASGKVYRHPYFHNGVFWLHGNFVARKKSAGWFSFLAAKRTLFFFEFAHTKGFNGIVTCTPLDEPVTESYSFLGFPLGFSTRRSGKLDSVCKTCSKLCDVPHPGIPKISECEHQHVEKVCGMCYLRSDVLHPRPGGFAFGYHKPYGTYPTKH